MVRRSYHLKASREHKIHFKSKGTLYLSGKRATWCLRGFPSTPKDLECEYSILSNVYYVYRNPKLKFFSLRLTCALLLKTTILCPGNDQKGLELSYKWDSKNNYSYKKCL